MDLVSLTIGLPLAPLRGLLALARLLEEEAEAQMYSPTEVRRELEEIESDQAEGRLSDEDAAESKQAVLDRLHPR